MAKQSNKIKKLEPIVNQLVEQTGQSALQTLFRLDPKTLLEIVIRYSEDDLFETFKEGDPGLSPEVARGFARAFKGIVEGQESKKKPGKTGSYHYALQVVNSSLGMGDKTEILCDDTAMTREFWRLEHVFLTLLHEYSHSTNPNDKDAYLGNIEPHKMDVIATEETQNLQQKPAAEPNVRQARVEVPFYEIAKRFCGGKPGATDKRSLLHLLEQYQKLVFKWKFKTETEDGRVLLIETTAKRVDVLFWSLADAGTAQQIEAGDVEAKAKSRNVILTFNPVFRSFVMKNHGYLSTPQNLDSILAIAAGGGKKLTAAHWRLFHYLNRQRTREKKTGILSTEIGYEKLLKILNLTGYAESRNEHKLKGQIERIFADLKKTGLLQSAKVRPGKEGKVFVFEINKNPVWVDPKTEPEPQQSPPELFA